MVKDFDSILWSECYVFQKGVWVRKHELGDPSLISQGNLETQTLNKPGLKICRREGALDGSLARSHGSADTAQSHSCQTVSVSMRACVGES